MSEKSAGSIYLHCDHTASHHLREIMDAIFGRKNFRNEIIWHYTNRLQQSGSQFARLNDSILFYSKTKDYKFHPQYDKKWKPSNTQHRRIEKGWEVRKGKLIVYDRTKFKQAGVDVSHFTQMNFDATANQPPIGNVWIMPILNPMAKERTGFSAPDPLLLLKRIIMASGGKATGKIQAHKNKEAA